MARPGQQTRTDRTADVIVVGAGFAGLYLIHKLRDELGLDVVVLERGDEVGGTWYWNRYPGARCDVESMFYCYSFDSELQQSWEWSERYPAQDEILEYINHVADRFDLRRSIRFGSTVEQATYSADDERWTLTTASGDRYSAGHFIAAVGCLSVPSTPNFPGLETFTGAVYHTGDWPAGGVNFTGQRVAVIGTGSSGVQVIPPIAAQAEQLTVFQRTATFVVPARNRPLTDIDREATRSRYDALRDVARHSRAGMINDTAIGDGRSVDPQVLRAELERRWWLNGSSIPNTLSDVLTSSESNELISEFVREKIREIVHDQDTARLLEPYDYPIGAKRIVLGTDYFETYNRANVRLVSIRDTPVEGFTEYGILVDGTIYEVDAVVLATGYDAMTGALLQIDIRGREGHSLREDWEAGPLTYLGLAVHGFPNMFIVTGPGSPSVFSNMVGSIEQHVDWIAEYIRHQREQRLGPCEPSAEAQRDWSCHVNELAAGTLLMTAASWYLGANIPGKPRVFMPYVGGVGNYREICDSIAADGYRGFEKPVPPSGVRYESQSVQIEATP